jgi:uncharacterized protein YqeY
VTLRERINEDIKTAMRARDTERLGTLRLLSSALKQREVDERIELSDNDVVAMIDKMLKQRRDSIAQFQAAGRQDLVDREQFEVGVLSGYMPQTLSSQEIEQAVIEAIAASGAQGAKDIGKVMATLKPKLTGRADLAQVSALVKARLA